MMPLILLSSIYKNEKNAIQYNIIGKEAIKKYKSSNELNKLIDHDYFL